MSPCDRETNVKKETKISLVMSALVVKVVGSLGFLRSAYCFVDLIWVRQVVETVFIVVVSSRLLITFVEYWVVGKVRIFVAQLNLILSALCRYRGWQEVTNVAFYLFNDFAEIVHLLCRHGIAVESVELGGFIELFFASATGFVAVFCMLQG
jgi:hypothetical protein